MSERRSWYHTIDLKDGSTTPGWYDTRAMPAKIEWPAGLRGGRCIDVGTFDGFWAFEMEQRGAGEVIALDVDDPEVLDWPYDMQVRGPELVREWGSERGPGFAEASRLLESKVTRLNKSVYDLDPATEGQFDVVLCGALLEHLQNPVRALERMRGVCGGELLLIEQVSPRLDLFARKVPAARFGQNVDEWWTVNSAGLAQLARTAGFEVTWVSRHFLLPPGPAAPSSWKFSRLGALMARQPFAKGLLFRALRARPRARNPGR